MESSTNLGGGDGGGDWPKASIGNYKGVMLCNRPNEFGQQKRPERTGLEPFNSRVDPKVPIGWNPSAKLLPRQAKKKGDPNSILVRHKKFLRQMGQQIVHQKQNDMDFMAEKENKTAAFKAAAAKQRDKIKGMKMSDVQDQNADMMNMIQGNDFEEERIETLAQRAPMPLTADNLSKASAPSVASKKKKQGASKPAWAKTEGQVEEDKEAEIDDLLEFAYELDYEKYMEDYEVRQALAIIKDRVNELTQEPDWKEQITEEWNQANDAEAAAKRERRAAAAADDGRSQVTYQSHMSKASKTSYVSRVSEAKRREAESRPDWNNASTTSERNKPSAEDRIATKIASEVLRDNHKLRGIHSNNSIKILLEKEAKRQMAMAANGGAYTGPVIAITKEKGNRDMQDPSNLPYLHKNPAI